MSNLNPYTSILQKPQGLCSLINFTPWCLWRHCMTSLHNATPWIFLVRLTVCLTHVLKRQETRRTFLYTCPYQANTESPSLASIAVTSAIAMFFEPFRRRKFSFRLGREDLNSSGLFFYRHLLAFVTSQVKSRLSRTEPEARCRRTRGSNLFLGWRHWVTENISLSPAHIIQSGTPCGCAQFKGKKKKNGGGKYNADESIPSQWFGEEDGNPRQ